MNNAELKIALILKKLMHEKNETLMSLSRATGVPKSTIADWMSSRTPNPLQAAQVAQHLGVSLHFLLFGKEDSQEPLQQILRENFFSGIFEVNIKRVQTPTYKLLKEDHDK